MRLSAVLAMLLLAATMHAADDLQPLFDAFAKERAAAKGGTAAAEKLAARAEEARKSENASRAALLIREARWALPALPTELPAGVRAFGYQRLRHDSRVNGVRFNVDGSLLLTCSNDRSVRIWDVATGRELLVYRGHTAENSGDDGKSGISGLPLRVADALFLPDGRAASAGGNQIHIWDAKTGKTLKVLSVKPNAKAAPAPLKCLAASSDGKFLAAGSDDKLVRVWNLEKGEESFTGSPHNNRIEGIAWQPKGKYVAAVDADGLLAVYDPTGENKSPMMKVQVTDGGQAALAVRFTSDGTKLITGGADGAPRIIPGPAADGSVPPNPLATSQKLPAHKGSVYAVGVTADGRHFLSGGPDRRVRAADALGDVVRYFDFSAAVTALDVRPDGRQVAIACDDGTVHLRDFQASDDHRTASEAKEPLWAAAVSMEGDLWATAGADKMVRVYSTAGKLLHSLESSTAAVTSLVFIPGGKLVSAGGDKKLRLWDAKAGKPLGEWPGHDAAILALAATPDGRFLVSGSADKAVKGWNAETGKVEWTWTARSAVAALAATKDGKTVLVGGADGGLSVLRIADGKATLAGFANAHVSGIAAIAFNAGESNFATVGGDGIPKIWTLPESGIPATALRLSPAVPSAGGAVALSALAWSPDSATLAAAGADRAIRLYDVKTGAETRSLRGCTDWVTALTYLPDGERLLAVSADKSARVFDVSTVESVTFSGHSRPARGVAVSPDGTQIASVGEDRVIRLWDRATGAELAVIPVAAETETLYTVAFVGPFLATGGKKGSSLRLWDRAAKKEVASASLGEIYGLTPSADGARLGVWSRGNADTYWLFKLPTLTQPSRSLGEAGRKVSAVSFASDLSTVASGDDAGFVRLWDLTRRFSYPNTIAVGKTRIGDVGLSPDRKLLIAADVLGLITIVNLETKAVAATVDLRGPEKRAYSAAGVSLFIAPAGNRFAAVGDRPELFVYDFAGKEVKKFALPSTPNGVAWTPDGKALVTANADGSVYVIDLS